MINYSKKSDLFHLKLNHFVLLALITLFYGNTCSRILFPKDSGRSGSSTTSNIGDKITSITVKTAQAGSSAQSYVTFGLPLAQGVLPAGLSIVIKDDLGNVYPSQTDIKATHADDSARMIIITVKFNTQTVDTNIKLNIHSQKAISPAAYPDLQIAINKGLAAEIDLEISGTIYKANLQSASMLSQPYSTWLNGQLVKEYLMKAPFKAGSVTHPLLEARFYVRIFENENLARVSTVVENTKAYYPNPSNVTYNLSVSLAGQNVFSKNALTHYSRARWSKDFWWGSNSKTYVKFVPSDFVKSRAIPNYDLSIVPNQSNINGYNVTYLANSDLMQAGLAEKYMPASGGRMDIGMIPGWCYTHLLSQDEKMYDACVGTAFLSGSWSVHFKDVNNDMPISLDNYPYATILGNAGDTYNPATGMLEAFPTCTDCATPLASDNAHQPSLVYYAYLLTGDYFLFEELNYWANLNLISSNPGYRDNIKGLIKSYQLRGQAWSMRSFFQAIYVMPKDFPTRANLHEKIINNIDYYKSLYINNPANPLAIMESGLAYPFGGESMVGIAPWQQDFFTSSIGEGYYLGYPEVRDLVVALSKFQIGRMLDPNYCYIFAAAYSLRVKQTQALPLYTTWKQVYENTFDPAVVATSCGSQAMATAFGQGLAAGELYGGSNTGIGYPSNMQPALAILVDLGVNGAQEAWDKFESRPVKPSYNLETPFQIRPK